MSDKLPDPEWAWWHSLLQTGDFPSPLQDGVIHFGYFRRSSDKKGANARWVPIGIWGSPKGIVCEVDGKRVADISRPPWRPFDLLFHKSLQAVSHETYMAVTRQKAPWPDAPPPLETPPPPLEMPPPDGSNPTPQPPTDDKWRTRNPPHYEGTHEGRYVVRIGDDGARTVSPQTTWQEVDPDNLRHVPADQAPIIPAADLGIQRQTHQRVPVPDDRKYWRIDENPGTDFPVQVPAADRDVDRHHNEPPDDQRLLYDKRAQLDEEQLLVAKRLQTAITTQDEANSVSEHANRIATLAKWFEGEYEQRNRPLLEAQKVIRVDYLHPSQEANELARTLTQHTAAFLLAEQKKLEEEQRKAAEAAVAKAAEEAARGIPPEEERPGAPPPPRRAGAGGLTGRRTTVREEPVAVITDYMEFAGVLIRGSIANPPPEYCSDIKLKITLDDLAQALAKKMPAGRQVSGMRVDKQAKARR